MTRNSAGLTLPPRHGSILDENAGSTLSENQQVTAYEVPLGTGIQIFQFKPGSISGTFGSVTKANFNQNLAFNLSNGTVLGLGSYTPQTFADAVSTTMSQRNAMTALLVKADGGVAQYHGGNLLPALTAALARGGDAVKVTFARWSPDAYAGITDQMKQSMLENLSDAADYDRLVSGGTFVTGGIHRNNIDGRQVDGYARNRFHDTAYQIGITHDLPFARLNFSYARSEGGFRGNNIKATVNGNLLGLNASAPLNGSQTLRLNGRVAYGDYDSKGVRDVIGGLARFGSVSGTSVVYGGGFGYYNRSGRTWINGNAEILGMHQTVERFTETGNLGLDLFNVRRQSRNTEIGRMNAQLGYAVTSSTSTFLKVGYVHDFGNSFTAVTADGVIDPISVTMTNPGLVQDRVNAGLGVQVDLNSGLRFGLDASAGNYDNYRVGGTVRFRF